MVRRVEEATSEHENALSIAQLYSRIEGALVGAFPRGRGVWVRGEIQSISDRTGHCYFDLVDPYLSRDRQAPVLKVKCWRKTWAPLKQTLARAGVDLQTGMVVVLRGVVDFYRPRAEVGFILSEVDVTALLGRMAAKRAALLAALEEEGLLHRNRRLAVPAVPLRIGLVASAGSEGYQDFVGQLDRSGFCFSVDVLPVRVQGASAPLALARAIPRLAGAGCDVVVLVRGGGSKADLAAFDTEPLARAIALSPVPVWTGIGHTGDESVADVVANRSFITPTECGRELAGMVVSWWEGSVVASGERLVRRAEEVLAHAAQRDAAARSRLAATARHQLQAHAERLTGRVDRLTTTAPRMVEAEHGLLTARTARIGPAAVSHVARAGERMASWRRLMAAYDVERQLERGYTLTMDSNGRVIRSVSGLSPGMDMTTRVADGTARSTVTTVWPRRPDDASPGDARHATGGGSAPGNGGER